MPVPSSSSARPTVVDLVRDTLAPADKVLRRDRGILPAFVCSGRRDVERVTDVQMSRIPAPWPGCLATLSVDKVCQDSDRGGDPMVRVVLP